MGRSWRFVIVSLGMALCACSDGDGAAGAMPLAVDLITSAGAGGSAGGVEIWRPGADAPPPEELRFQQIGPALGVGGASIQLANGRVVLQLRHWQAVLIANTSRGACTASLVGPRVLLMAAHCVDKGRRPADVGGGMIELASANNLQRRFRCVMPDAYRNAPVHPEGGVRLTRDFALCLLTSAIPTNSGMTFESISTVAIYGAGSDVLLMGFGCTRVEAVRDRDGRRRIVTSDNPGDPSGRLHFGDEKLSGRDATADGLEASGIYAFTLSRNNEEPVLCPGDSGGPVFLGASIADQTGPRRVIAVNSAVGLAPEDGQGATFVSLFAPTATADFIGFIEKFESDNPAVVICGRGNAAPGVGVCHG